MVESDKFLEKARAHWTEARTAKITGKRRYPIMPLEGALLLRSLGLLNNDASMSADSVRKYVQINHMVTLLEPFFLDLAKRFSVVRVLDCGCGSSYLTFLVAWCFSNRWNHPCEILGVDSNQKLVDKCIRQANELGYGKFLRFAHHDLAGFSWADSFGSVFEVAEPGRPHATIALHACDTATDLALGIGLANKSDFVAVAPCCHAELARKWSGLAQKHVASPFSVVYNAPNLRRDLAAGFTDSMRILLMRGSGYEVSATEFVPSQHTPKNRLITCQRRGNYSLDALSEYLELKAALSQEGILLEEHLAEEASARLLELSSKK